MRWGGFGSKAKGKKLQTSFGFRVLQGGEVLVAKQKGKNLQTSLGFRVFEDGQLFVAK